MHEVWKCLLTEFIGTFVFVFIGAGAVALTAAQGATSLGTAFAFGLAFITLFYAWSVYSGAHFNPAVSFGYAVAGKMNWALMLGYWVVQLLGAILAAAVIAYFFGTQTGAGASVGTFTYTDKLKAVLLEGLLTFFLVMTVLLVTKNPTVALYSGFAIGLVYTFAYINAGDLTGASMNPARSLGPALFSSNMGTYWIYVVGPLVGALLAALVFRLMTWSKETSNGNCKTLKDTCGKPVLDACGKPIQECKLPINDQCGKPLKDACGKPLSATVIKVPSNRVPMIKTTTKNISMITSDGLLNDF